MKTLTDEEVREHMEAITAKQEELRAAIQKGIESAGADLDPIEIGAIRDEVEVFAGGLEEDPGIPIDAVLAIAEYWAHDIAENPLKVRLLVAENIENQLTDYKPTADGLLGQAAERVISQLLPYARRVDARYRDTAEE